MTAVVYKQVDPLSWQAPIVDPETGAPSTSFAQIWQNLFKNGEAIQGDYVSALRQILTGNGLQGGGDLSADRTLSVKNGTGLNFDGSGHLKIADTVVTPGTYGDATHVGQFTVDQQGRLTGAANVAITGGGGGTSLWNISAGVPAAAAFTQQNFQGTTALTEVAGKALILKTDKASSVGTSQICSKAVPASPYRIAILVEAITFTANQFVNFGWRDPVTGHLQFLFVQQTGVFVQSYTNYGTFSSNQIGGLATDFGCNFWVGLRDDGTNIYFEFSADGVNFVELYSVAKAAGFLGSTGYSTAFFGAWDNVNTNSILMTIRVWDENGLTRTFP